MKIRKVNKLLNLCYKIGIFAKIYQLSRNRYLWEYISKKKMRENNNVPKRRYCQNVTTIRKVAYILRPLHRILRETIAIVDCQHERMQKNYCSLRARHRGFNQPQVGIFVSIRSRIRIRNHVHNAVKNNHILRTT